MRLGRGFDAREPVDKATLRRSIDYTDFSASLTTDSPDVTKVIIRNDKSIDILHRGLRLSFLHGFYASILGPRLHYYRRPQNFERQ